MDDLISRQAAIDALRNYLVGKNVPCDGTLTCRLIENEVINKLPLIQPEPHWIPVTERLPDEDQPVLVTDGAVMWVCSLIRTDDGYKWENNMGYWHDFDEWEAWKSLPEPYKGVTE